MRLKSHRVAIAPLLVVAAAFIHNEAHSQPSGNQYVDPALCASCHAAIADNFRQTGMGQSFRRVQNIPPAPPFHHAESGTYFSIVERSGKYSQRRWQLGFDGRETNVDEKQIDFVLGSGTHSQIYLHLTNRNTLTQLPLGWYAEKGGYFAMNPGYDRPDFPGAIRELGYACMFCHNAYPAIPNGHQEQGAEAQYTLPLPEGIDCQRCHGPGQRHVSAARKAGAKPEEIRAAIVNPARLASERELEVCLQCHLESTNLPLPGSVQRQNRGPFSYIPGQPLGDFRLSFDRATKHEDRMEVAHAGYRLLESQCYLKSEGKLRCTTCHDPHAAASTTETAAAHYNRICMTCHQQTIPTAIASGAHTANGACVTCHMPERRTDEAVHMVMTDHRIVRRPSVANPLAEKNVAGESPAAAYRGEVIPYYPARLAATPENDLDVAVAQLRDRSNLNAGLPRLASLIGKYKPLAAAYYADLADGYLAAGDPSRAWLYFDQAVRHAPTSAAISVRYGNALVESGLWPKAEAVLRGATARAPDDAVAWGLLGEALSRQDKLAEAKAAFGRGLQLNSELPELHNRLGALLVHTGDLPAAEEEFRAALRIEPGIAEWQSNLANLLASRNALAEARYYFERSIRLNPGDAASRLGYARLLANSNQIDAAEQQANAAVDFGPAVAAAHELWGYLLAAKGNLDGAVTELQTSLRLQPGLWRAHYELGSVLLRKGDSAAALPHLKLAAQGADPAAKAAAEQLLQRLAH